MRAVVELPEFTFDTAPTDIQPVDKMLQRIARFGRESINALRAATCLGGTSSPLAAVGRIRGRGTAASFTRLVRHIETRSPLELAYPFEGSDRVGGACWVVSSEEPDVEPASIAMLRWESRALDLPMHVHEHSDRAIIVLEGRGYFHVSASSVENFVGDDVATVAAREMDVFLFRRGTIHTFSTLSTPMTLLSCQLPFVPFDDPRQYKLPPHRWCASSLLTNAAFEAACEPSWTVLAHRELWPPKTCGS